MKHRPQDSKSQDFSRVLKTGLPMKQQKKKRKQNKNTFRGILTVLTIEHIQCQAFSRPGTHMLRIDITDDIEKGFWVYINQSEA